MGPINLEISKMMHFHEDYCGFVYIIVIGTALL